MSSKGLLQIRAAIQKDATDSGTIKYRSGSSGQESTNKKRCVLDLVKFFDHFTKVKTI
jgi:hypothetical protein